jgi:hypothetical protein
MERLIAALAGSLKSKDTIVTCRRSLSSEELLADRIDDDVVHRASRTQIDAMNDLVAVRIEDEQIAAAARIEPSAVVTKA